VAIPYLTYISPQPRPKITSRLAGIFFHHTFHETNVKLKSEKRKKKKMALFFE
jgi:hypothetical protein